MASCESEESEEQPSRADYERLAEAAPNDRAEVLFGVLKTRTDDRLALPAHDGLRAVLDGADFGRTPPLGRLRGANLRGASLRKANLRGIDLARADLRETALGRADLGGALLEETLLRDSDMAGADLQEAALAKADLRGALLEEAKLKSAGLRFADLRGATLENADLRGADLWGANLDGAVLIGADLRGAVLKECSLRNADLRGANLEGTPLGNVDLRGANLSEAMLHGVVLTTSKIDHVRLSGAWMDRTRVRPEQFGGALGEEQSGDFDGAWRGYLSLERNFAGLGDADASSWAYRKRRRMQKRAALAHARSALAARNWRAAAAFTAKYLSDGCVEWLCDYGESVPRVLGALVLLHVFFATLYGLTGSVMRVHETKAGPAHVATHNVLDLATFSLLVSTSGSPAVGLVPRDESVHLLTAMEAILGIALTGLLGFVVGNRIRR